MDQDADLDMAVLRLKATHDYSENYEAFGDPNLSDDQLERLLEEENPYGKYLVISNFEKIRQRSLSKKSLALFCLCLRHIPNVLNKHNCEPEINNIMRKFLEKAVEKGQVYFKILDLRVQISVVTGIFSEFLPDSNKYWNLNQSIGRIYKELEEFAKLTEKVKQKWKKYPKWKSLVDKILENGDLDLGDEVDSRSIIFHSMQERIQSFGFIEEKCNNLLKYIENTILRLKSKECYIPMIRKIDKEILDVYQLHISSSQEIDLNLIKNIAITLKNEFNELLNYSLENYNSTSAETFPDTQSLICCAARSILDIIHTENFYFFYKVQMKKIINHKVHLRPKIDLLNSLPANVQYVIFELLMQVNQADISAINYLFNKVSRNMIFETINQGWANDFVRIACKPTFEEAFNKFKNPEVPLQELIETATKNILLIELPSRCYGLNLKNNSICIKRVGGRLESKGYIFIVYLHKLGNFLQRVNCSDIGEFYDQNSLKQHQKGIFKLNEGGKELETYLFGEQLSHVTQEAAHYIINEEIPESLEEFQYAFKEKNTLRDASMYKASQDFILFKKTNRSIYLGKCGFVPG